MLKIWTMVLAIVSVLVTACAAPAVQSPSATPTSAPPPSAPISAAAPGAISPDGEAWAKVVDAAKKEGVVLLYTFSLAGEAGVAVAKAFKDKYGVKAEVLGGTSPVMLERVRAEYRAGQYIADLANFSSARALVLKRDGMTASNKDLPALRDRAAWNTYPLDLDPEGHLFAFYSTESGPWINTQLVKPVEEPKSWLDLVDAKWKGKLIAGDPGVYIGADQDYYAMVTKSGRLTQDYYLQLRGQIRKFVAGGAVDNAAALARGEGHINITTSSAGAASLVSDGAPIKSLDLKEGYAAKPAPPFMILSKAPHPNAARLFLNWFLSAEGLTVWAKAASAVTSRKDVPNFMPTAARTDPSKWVVVDFTADEKTEKMYSEGFMLKLWKGEVGK